MSSNTTIYTFLQQHNSVDLCSSIMLPNHFMNYLLNSHSNAVFVQFVFPTCSVLSLLTSIQLFQTMSSIYQGHFHSNLAFQNVCSPSQLHVILSSVSIFYLPSSRVLTKLPNSTRQTYVDPHSFCSDNEPLISTHWTCFPSSSMIIFTLTMFLLPAYKNVLWDCYKAFLK